MPQTGNCKPLKVVDLDICDGAVNDRDLLAARNIRKFGLEKQNLLTQDNINKSPVVNREGDVELSTSAGAVKRQIISV